jgi:peptidoglycan/LPS O-acetylase OafA/YrhL
MEKELGSSMLRSTCVAGNNTDLATVIDSTTSSISAQTGQVERNSTVDFTKGILVLLMVLYHWINYFVSRQGDFYKYLRFITPSFIFLTGFLIANVYLSKYPIGDPRLHKRLIRRGFKLLALFTFLNIAGSFVLTKQADGTPTGIGALSQNAISIYLTGNGKTAAFSVLVPISYVLILSSCLLFLCKWHKYFLHEVCLLLFVSIYILDLNGLQSANLELFTVGLLGIVLGRIPLTKVNRLAFYPLPLMAAYGAYMLALNVWGEIYPLQVSGVCLSLALIYVLGMRAGEQGWAQSRTILLGKYSLLAYVVQIGVVLLLSSGLRRLNLGHGTLVVSWVAAFGLTMATVEIVDLARSKSKAVDSLYKVLFC